MKPALPCLATVPHPHGEPCLMDFGSFGWRWGHSPCPLRIDCVRVCVCSSGNGNSSSNGVGNIILSLLFCHVC
jgi:hypothetical protein